MNPNRLMFSGLIVTTALFMAACGSSSSGSNPSAANAIQAMKSDVVNHMKSAVPSGSSSLSSKLASLSDISTYAAASWDSPNAGLRAPGCTESGQSVKSYVLSVLNPEYKCNEFLPTAFGRFSQSMEVLSIIGTQVPFENGVPKVGTHQVSTTINIDGQAQTVSFDVVVTAVTSSHFDVRLEVTQPIQLVSFMKNRDNTTNFIGIETNSNNDIVTSVGVSILYWNRSTNALTYTYASRKETRLETQKLLIDADGKARIAHSIENAGSKIHLLIDAPEGSKSTTSSIAFEQTGADDIDKTDFCVTVADMSASTGALCASVTMSMDNFQNTTNTLNGASFTDLTSRLFGGTGSDEVILDKTPDYTLSNFESFAIVN